MTRKLVSVITGTWQRHELLAEAIENVHAQTYRPLAHMVDIGCCAVADTPFSRAKTPIKAWEYAAAGAAVVATPALYGGCV
jgi:hypothetical protein